MKSPITYYDPKQFIGLDGAYLDGITPLYPDFDKDPEIVRHDYAKDTRYEWEKKLDQIISTDDPSDFAIRMTTAISSFAGLVVAYYFKVSYKRPVISGIQSYFLMSASFGLPTFFLMKAHYTREKKREAMLFWYLRQHREDWPKPYPKRTFGELLLPWTPYRIR